MLRMVSALHAVSRKGAKNAKSAKGKEDLQAAPLRAWRTLRLFRRLLACLNDLHEVRLIDVMHGLSFARGFTQRRKERKERKGKGRPPGCSFAGLAYFASLREPSCFSRDYFTLSGVLDPKAATTPSTPIPTGQLRVQFPQPVQRISPNFSG